MTHLNPRLFVLALALSVGACESYDSVSRGWIGDTADHLVAARGKPTHVVEQPDGRRSLEFFDVFYLAQPPVGGAMPSIPQGPTMSAPMGPAPSWGSVAAMHGVGPMATPMGPPPGASLSQSAAWMGARSDYDSQVRMASMGNSANAATPTPTGSAAAPPRASGSARPCRTTFNVDAAGIVMDVQFAGPGCSWPVGKLLDARYFPTPRTAPAKAADTAGR